MKKGVWHVISTEAIPNLFALSQIPENIFGKRKISSTTTLHANVDEAVTSSRKGANQTATAKPGVGYSVENRAAIFPDLWRHCSYWHVAFVRRTNAVWTASSNSVRRDVDMLRDNWTLLLASISFIISMFLNSQIPRKLENN